MARTVCSCILMVAVMFMAMNEKSEAARQLLQTNINPPGGSGVVPSFPTIPGMPRFPRIQGMPPIPSIPTTINFPKFTMPPMPSSFPSFPTIPSISSIPFFAPPPPKN
ncbi:uncharacterized protein LOC132626873 [Lycium barbarum]|uniref:uncharacterized protein LOC132626873 n=1 Tax=Lycium barbarum TaxID=112863 RepID=UPI00293F3B16|nr:uncharacterized protein LOC132626873 [Lycium barbarum]